MSMCAQGVLPTNCSKKLGGRDGAAPAAVADVLDVGHFAFDLLVVDFRIHGQLPDRLADASRPRRSPRRTRAGRWSSCRPLRCPGPPRKRRSAWPGRRSSPTPKSTASDSTSASTSRPSASVLCTSIVRPLRARSTSPSFMAAGPVMFSTSPAMPITLIGNFKLRDGLHGADHGRRSGHVALHREHALGRFERQSAGIERHSLADDGQSGASAGARPGNAA